MDNFNDKIDFKELAKINKSNQNEINDTLLSDTEKTEQNNSFTIDEKLKEVKKESNFFDTLNEVEHFEPKKEGKQEHGQEQEQEQELEQEQEQEQNNENFNQEKSNFLDIQDCNNIS